MRLHAGCVLRLFEPLQCETCSFCLRHSPCGKDCAELFVESSFKHLSSSLRQHNTSQRVRWCIGRHHSKLWTSLNYYTHQPALGAIQQCSKLCTGSDLSWYIARLSTGIQVSKTSFGTDIQVKHGKKSFLCI